MIISFNNDKEVFNGKEYFVGSAFIFIYNQMSQLVYNDDCWIDSYKDHDFYCCQYQAIKELCLEKTFNLNMGKLNDYNKSLIGKENIEIEGINIAYKEFKELVFFAIQLDEFIRIASTDKRLQKPEKFLFFFTVINDYSFPECTIIDEELSEKYKKSLEVQSRKYKDKKETYEVGNNYRQILDSDKKILREIGESENVTYQYNCKDFIEVLLVSYFHILDKKIHLKQCENCKRFFIPRNGNQKYCDNIRPQYINETDEEYSKNRMSCREYNVKLLSYNNLSEVKQTIRRIKARIVKRIKKGKEDEKYLEEWEFRVKKARKKYIKDNDYIKWLNNESDINQRRRSKNGSTRNNTK